MCGVDLISCDITLFIFCILNQDFVTSFLWPYAERLRPVSDVELFHKECKIARTKTMYFLIRSELFPLRIHHYFQISVFEKIAPYYAGIQRIRNSLPNNLSPHDVVRTIIACNNSSFFKLGSTVLQQSASSDR